MARLPALRHCLVAEQVRAEVNGANTLIGFMGVSPHVAFTVKYFPIVMNLSVLLICESGGSAISYDLEVEILGPSGIAFPRTKNTLLNAKDRPTVTCAINFQSFPLLLTGEYHIRLFSEGLLHSDNVFTAYSHENKPW